MRAANKAITQHPAKQLRWSEPPGCPGCCLVLCLSFPILKTVELLWAARTKGKGPRKDCFPI